MLVNLSLAIRYGPSLRSGPNLMVLVKGLPTYTYSTDSTQGEKSWFVDQHFVQGLFSYNISGQQSFLVKHASSQKHGGQGPPSVGTVSKPKEFSSSVLQRYPKPHVKTNFRKNSVELDRSAKQVPWFKISFRNIPIPTSWKNLLVSII